MKSKSSPNDHFEMARRMMQMTGEFILIRPTSKYASQIVAYRQEFLDAGDSMDGTGPLRRIGNPEEYIKTCAEYEDPD